MPRGIYLRTEETLKKLSKANSREKNPAWKGGRKKHDGYIFVRLNNGYIAEHRLIMEQYLGRKLYVWEMVHHINGIKDDNRIENLQIENSSEHRKTHHQLISENLILKQRILELELMTR